jgi:2-polyprenyl-6-methoxyphenol hydroxylase-like FAD-dependent oxidoreductase
MNISNTKQNLKKSIFYSCCIVGGGPAGIMLGYIMAKYGVEVVVMEKHKDFFRDFRGDTIHPSTLNILDELGDLDDFLKVPHDKMTEFTMTFGDKQITLADFKKLNIKTPFIAFTPQWNFLNFLTEKAQKLPNFNLLMATEAIDILQENGKVVGVKALSEKGEVLINSNLVVGADGRHSIIRKKASLNVYNLGSPIDVLWFRLNKPDVTFKKSFANSNKGKFLILIDRTEYWQCGFITTKGNYENLKSMGIVNFQNEITSILPELKDVVTQLTNFEQIKNLSVTVDRLEKWYTEGLICIGDSAHAMSPIGGVGINLAIQDAVAMANVLVPIFKNSNIPASKDLKKIQKRRMFPTKFTQGVQLLIQNKSLKPFLTDKKKDDVPSFLKLLKWFPPLRILPARFIGLGVRTEKIEL